jgi:hypothetical protein
METVHVVVAASSNAPMNWVWGTIASVVFVGLIGVPAAALNARDRKRRQQQRAATPEAQGTH